MHKHQAKLQEQEDFDTRCPEKEREKETLQWHHFD